MEGRSHGWIDVLGCYPQTGALLVVEVKTEIDDVGHIERAMAWYEREAPSAARRFGWNAHKIVGVLIVLDTRATARRLRENREAIAQSFPTGPSGLLAACVAKRQSRRGQFGRWLPSIRPAVVRCGFGRPCSTAGEVQPRMRTTQSSAGGWLASDSGQAMAWTGGGPSSVFG